MVNHSQKDKSGGFKVSVTEIAPLTLRGNNSCFMKPWETLRENEPAFKIPELPKWQNSHGSIGDEDGLDGSFWIFYFYFCLFNNEEAKEVSEKNERWWSGRQLAPTKSPCTPFNFTAFFEGKLGLCDYFWQLEEVILVTFRVRQLKPVCLLHLSSCLQPWL